MNASTVTQIVSAVLAAIALIAGVLGFTSSSEPATPASPGADVVDAGTLIGHWRSTSGVEDLTLAFEPADGGQYFISVSTACNSGATKGRISDGVLRISPLPLTKMACYGQARWEEAKAIRLLSSKPKVSMTGDRLRLSGPELSANFVRG